MDYADESITLSDLRTRWEMGSALGTTRNFRKFSPGPEPKTIRK
jgi:hypothetical protein